MNRKSIFDFLNFKDKSIYEDPIHPTLQQIYSELKFYSNNGYKTLFDKFKEIIIEQKIISSSPEVILDLIHFNDLKNTISVKLTQLINNMLESTNNSTIVEFNNSVSDVESNNFEKKLFNVVFDEIDAYEVYKRKNMGKLYKR